MFKLSVLGDELAEAFEDQVAVAAANGLRFVELRTLWGKNILQLGGRELERAHAVLRQAGVAASGIASPVGKSPVDGAWTDVLAQFRQAVAAAEAVGTRNIRVFSFYVSDAETGRHRAVVIRRLQALADLAGAAGVHLGLENEVGLYGDVPGRLMDILAAVDSPALSLTFDPANFVRVGVRPFAAAWVLLSERVGCLHVKDARFDGSHHPAGDGDGEIPDLISALQATDYQGFLTLEPHLSVAGANAGFTGPERFRDALGAVRSILAAQGAAGA